MSEEEFAGNWIEFLCVLVESPPVAGHPACSLLHKWDIESLSRTTISPECKYFTGLKGISNYHSKLEFGMSPTELMVRDEGQSNFSVIAFPLPAEGFEDHRKFYLQSSLIQDSVVQEPT